MIVIGILALLLAITVVAINPSRLFINTRNTKRLSDVRALLDAIEHYTIDQKGVMTASISASPQFLSDSASNLCSQLVPKYIAALPQDPTFNGGRDITDCSTYNSYYQLYKDSNNRITVFAPATEAPAPTIFLTR